MLAAKGFDQEIRATRVGHTLTLLSHSLQRPMALITCPECNNGVSSEVTACPACGSPVPKGPGGVVTTQRTAKKYKATKAVAVCGMLAGLALLWFGINGQMPITVATCVLAVAFVLYVYAEAAAWWNHG